MSSSVAQDPSSRVVTRARIGFRARVTYFELGCPETNIDPIIVYFVSASPPILARRYETLIDIYVAQGSHVSRLTLAVESPRKVYTRGIIGTW